MAYYLDLFTPQTWEAFRRNGSKVSGFSRRQLKTAQRIRPGDVFICYLVHLSRWCGVLNITSKHEIDETPIFADPDPFVVRFKVDPLVTLDFDRAVPIFEEEVWHRLSITREIPMRVQGWAQHANMRASLRRLTDEDGAFLVETLEQQQRNQRYFELSTRDLRKIRARRAVPVGDRTVVIDVPDEFDDDDGTLSPVADETHRESHRIQAELARIGARMGFRIWIPAGDRQRVLEQVDEETASAFLKNLPLNYDDNTIRTIEQIDVIWIDHRAMARAFEVEHTTAIYSGILRMADLVALQPNMDISLHIVAPRERQEKVLGEIVRPVFSLLGRKPLYERCTYLTYDAVYDIGKIPTLQHTNDTVLDDFAISAEEEVL